MDKLWNQKGSLHLPTWSWLELRSASEGSEARCERRGDFCFTGGAACFLAPQSHHRYPQVVGRTLKSVTHQEAQMESPRDDNLNPDNDYMYTVTTCRCLVVQTLC